jgi:isopentenyl-diphosphate delta-isomerase
MQKRTVTHMDEQGNELGQVDIYEAHTGKGILHKGFSVYVFRNNGQELLIQKRADKKMLWPGFWVNTCCSHPFEGEGAKDAGMRRLHEELGFTYDIEPLHHFIYRAEDTGRGVEHEYLTIMRGDATEELNVQPNPDEVSDWKWIDVDLLQKDMNENPAIYTPWFHLGLKSLLHPS